MDTQATLLARMLGRMLRDRLALSSGSAHERVAVETAFQAGLEDPKDQQAWVPLQIGRRNGITQEYSAPHPCVYVSTDHREVVRFALHAAGPVEDITLMPDAPNIWLEAAVDADGAETWRLFAHPDDGDPTHLLEVAANGDITHEYLGS